MTVSPFTAVTASQAGFSAGILAELDAHFEDLVGSGMLPGHVLLLARGDRLVHSHVTGYAEWETKSPLHADTIFTLFSMTKPLTAVAMLLLYDEGRWQLDDPVSRYLPEFEGIARLPGSQATRVPTLRETFTHTAGFSFGATREEMLARMEILAWHRARSLSELVGRLARMPLDYEPGTAWEYSAATDLQAEIVERLTGERMDLFLKRRLFDPLGMDDTRFVLEPPQLRRLAPSYMYDHGLGRLRLAAFDERMESVFPMGGTSFKSTAMDFARLGRMLLNRGVLGDVRILQPETVDMMFADHLPDSLIEDRYHDAHYVIGQGNGHGLNGMVCVDPAKAGRPVGRGTYEWGGAFGTWFWFDPEHDIVCIGMTNRRRVAADMRPLESVAQDIIYRALRS